MRFSVITATLNRAHTLGMVYESLCAQTCRDFEWIIVDGGSTDGTQALVSSWQSFFPIRYVWQANLGQYPATNVGVSMAGGEFVLLFDSDDRCIPTALERFDYHWRQIPDPSRFATVGCLCRRVDGSIVGKPYPADYVDAFTYADQLRYRYAEGWGRCAERWGINRTDVLREFPFPEVERFVPPGLIWNRISRKYAMRFVNEALRIYEPSMNYVTVTRLRISSPKQTLMYYRELALSPAPLIVRMRAALNYCRFAAIDAQRRLAGRFLGAGKSQ